MACQEGRTEVVEMMLKSGADPNQSTTVCRETIVHASVQFSVPQIELTLHLVPGLEMKLNLLVV